MQGDKEFKIIMEKFRIDNSLLMFLVTVGLSVVLTAQSIEVGYILHKGKIIERFVYGKYY